MTSIKCPQCGLVSFAGSFQCKRCRRKLVAPPAAVAVAEEQPLALMPAEEPLPVRNDIQPTPDVKPFEPPPEYEVKATPISGWLVVFVIGLGLFLGLSALGIQKYIALFSTREFHELTAKGSRLYIRKLSLGATTEFIWTCTLAVSSIILLVRIFSRRSSFPRLVISLLSINVIFAFFGYLIAFTARNELSDKLTAIYGKGNVPEVLPSYFGLMILSAIVTSMLWIGYFLTSRRVESTFIY